MTTGTPVPHPEDCEVFPTEGRSFLNQPSSFSPFIFPRSVSYMRAGRGFFMRSCKRRSGGFPARCRKIPQRPYPITNAFGKSAALRVSGARRAVFRPLPGRLALSAAVFTRRPADVPRLTGLTPCRRYVKISRRANRRKQKNIYRNNCRMCAAVL